jgi:predicted phosphodiesterase
MKKILRIAVWIILLAAAYSLAPVAMLYISGDPAPYTNSRAIEKLRANAGDRFEFIVFGDNHAGLLFNDSAALKLVWNINREGRFMKMPVDFVAIAGDVTFQASEWDYRIFNRIRSRIRPPVICATGNHDNDRGGAERFGKNIGKREFAFNDRNSFFIFIDNASGDLTDAQFVRLEEWLKSASAYRHTFVITHKAPLSPYQQSWFRPETGPWSYRFMKLCEKYRVDIVFSGHEHMFKELAHGGVKYVTSGGGGMFTHIPAYDGGCLHYLVVRVYGDYVDYEVRKIRPPFWEFLTYYMWKDLFYLVKDILM